MRSFISTPPTPPLQKNTQNKHSPIYTHKQQQQQQQQQQKEKEKKLGFQNYNHDKNELSVDT